MPSHTIQHDEVQIQAAGAVLDGTLTLPPDARGLVIFAHGSGSNRFSSRNRSVAETLHQSGLGTLLFDLLTAQENRIDELTGTIASTLSGCPSGSQAR